MVAFDVSAEYMPDAGAWVIRVDDVGAAAARSWDDVTTVAARLIAEASGGDASAVDMRVEWLLPFDVADALDSADTHAREEQDAHHARMLSLRRAARLLRDFGMPGRDVARVLGISKSRVFQLAAEVTSEASATSEASTGETSDASTRGASTGEASATPR
ncbi:MAG: hypothetical protein ACRDP8_14235 [Actinopolymorphaceae bacterium]